MIDGPAPRIDGVDHLLEVRGDETSLRRYSSDGAAAAAGSSDSRTRWPSTTDISDA